MQENSVPEFADLWAARLGVNWDEAGVKAQQRRVLPAVAAGAHRWQNVCAAIDELRHTATVRERPSPFGRL